MSLSRPQMRKSKTSKWFLWWAFFLTLFVFLPLANGTKRQTSLITLDCDLNPLETGLVDSQIIN